MNLVCYLPAELPANHPLRRLVLHGLHQFTRQVYESLSGLERRLSCPGEPGAILVLVALDERALEAMLAMGELYRAHSVVLLLPEDQDPLQRLGHRLRPRFMAGLDCATAELEAVLRRLGSRSLRQGEAANSDPPGEMDQGANPGRRLPAAGVGA